MREYVHAGWRLWPRRKAWRRKVTCKTWTATCGRAWPGPCRWCGGFRRTSRRRPTASRLTTGAATPPPARGCAQALRVRGACARRVAALAPFRVVQDVFAAVEAAALAAARGGQLAPPALLVGMPMCAAAGAWNGHPWPPGPTPSGTRRLALDGALGGRRARVGLSVSPLWGCTIRACGGSAAGVGVRRGGGVRPKWARAAGLGW